ncbi:MAG: VCBS repeat-containing protein [Bacteroidales bacterium]|nr:VCBS repeat-containing protein [Bacteroidales bacterium]MDD3989805.1 VCBS repeat-containing protein [Bacteroidales bacterium]MDD4639483.1 VCBS repeat-containing protein [Bacteroidales bacterium]
MLTVVVINTYCYSQLPKLHMPFKIEAAGKVIDLYGSGHAAPFIFDFDGDGRKDLIVGEFDAPISREVQLKFKEMTEEDKRNFVKPFGGKARIYINKGTDESPVFGDYTYLQAGETDASVESVCCIGFDPFVVDLDGDGVRDVTSGEYKSGFIHLYKGIKGKPFEFQAPIDIAQPDTVLKFNGTMVRNMRTANFIDFDNDGDFDMIWGNVLGEVYLSKNIGTKLKYEFTNSVSLTVYGKQIIVDGKSDPFPVDWDNDGIIDLLVGTEAGDIIFFKGKNEADTDFEPGVSIWTGRVYYLGEKPSYFEIKRSLDALKEERPYPENCYRVRLAVADWNNDNKLDLIVGNTYSCEREEKSMEISGNIYVFLQK